MELQEIEFKSKSGDTPFENCNKSKTLLDYWEWAYSDLIGNTERGILAEYIVSLACNIDLKPRISWNSYDLELDNGIKIEVKSSAYLQTWKQKQFSKPSFNIGKTKAWDYIENTYEVESKRQADVYVFALLSHKDKKTLNPIDTSQWEFYVLSTKEIDEKLGDSKQVSLNTLIKMNAIKCDFSHLLFCISNISTRG